MFINNVVVSSMLHFHPTTPIPPKKNIQEDVPLWLVYININYMLLASLKCHLCWFFWWFFSEKNDGGFWFSTLLQWPSDATFIQSTPCVTWISCIVSPAGKIGKIRWLHGETEWDHWVLVVVFFYNSGVGWVHSSVFGVLLGVGGCIYMFVWVVLSS